MPENRKYFAHNTVLFCTARTEIGLPLIATHTMNFILWGILARAREQFAVKVCHFIFMANHFHLLLTVDNPQDVSRFIGYIKAESAHAINHLLGRRQRTIWQDGYDSPVVLSAQDAMKCIRYIYLNPSKPGLVNSIDEYPGVSSWQMYSAKAHKKRCKRLNRDAIEPLFSPALSINEQKRMVAQYEVLSPSSHTFELDPDAWMSCFPELRGASPEEINRQALRGIRSGEADYTAARKRDKRDVLGSTALRRESMLKDYTPETHGRKSICLCFDKERRKEFINMFRLLCAEAKLIYQRWREGDTSLRMPLGLCPPQMPPHASLLGISA